MLSTGAATTGTAPTQRDAAGATAERDGGTDGWSFYVRCDLAEGHVLTNASRDILLEELRARTPSLAKTAVGFDVAFSVPGSLDAALNDAQRALEWSLRHAYLGRITSVRAVRAIAHADYDRALSGSHERHYLDLTASFNAGPAATSNASSE